jgi:hypothetical protein
MKGGARDWSEALIWPDAEQINERLHLLAPGGGTSETGDVQ